MSVDDHPLMREGDRRYYQKSAGRFTRCGGIERAPRDSEVREHMPTSLLIEQPVAAPVGIPRDEQWLVAKIPGNEGSSTQAIPVSGGPPVKVTESGGFGQGDHKVLWPVEGNQILSGSLLPPTRL